ncbi:MAG TPA: hypothetical protein VEX86_13585 [Longimicrobium sp.]|nr:hypothetical protein [Longimicrobium sp.]
MIEGEASHPERMMDHDDTDVPAEPEHDDAPPISDLERRILEQRSAAYRQDPGAVVPLDDALDEIERRLTDSDDQPRDETATPPQDLSMRSESSRRPRGERRYSLQDLLAQVTEENRHDFIDSAPSVGREFTGDEWEECQPAAAPAPAPPSTPR